MVIVSNLSNFIFMFITSAIVDRVSEKWRVQGSLGFSLAAMLIITAMTYINTDDWQEEFYVLTMILIALLNAFIAILQGSGTGMAGMFPTICVKNMVSGQALAGVFSSLARIISLAIAGLEEQDPRLSALVYFILADLTLLLTMAAYYYCTTLDYYIEMTDRSDGDKNEEAKQTLGQQWSTYKTVLRKIWPMGFTLSMVLTITLSVFPAVLVYVTSVYPPSQWTEPGPSGLGVHLLGLSRAVLIPLLLLCHGENKTFPTLLDHDAYYIVLILILGVSGGYVSTLTFIFYPKLVESSELELGGSVLVALCGPGVLLGSLISPAFVALWGPT